MSWQAVIMGVIALLGGGGGLYSALTVGATKRKIVADAEAVTASTTIGLGKAAVEMIDPLRARIRELEEEVTILRRQIRTLQEEGEQAVRLRTRLEAATQEAGELRALLLEKERVIAALSAARGGVTGAEPSGADQP